MTILVRTFPSREKVNFCIYTNDIYLIDRLMKYYRLININVDYSPNEYGYKDLDHLKDSCLNEGRGKEYYSEYEYQFGVLKEEQEATIEYFKIEGLDATIHDHRCGDNNKKQGEPVQPVESADGGGVTV